MVSTCPPVGNAVAQAPPRDNLDVLDRMKGAVTTMLEFIGEDPDREGLRDTPKRVAKAWLDMTRGTTQDPTQAFGSALFHEPCLTEAPDGLVLVRDIAFASLSSSALLPFYGAVHVAYLPRAGTILGLSKLARVTEVLAARLQGQGTLARALLAAVDAELASTGAAVVCVARHLGREGSGLAVAWDAAGALRCPHRLAELELLLELEQGTLAPGTAGREPPLPAALGEDGEAGSTSSSCSTCSSSEVDATVSPGRAQLVSAVQTLVEGVATATNTKVDPEALAGCAVYADWLLAATVGYRDSQGAGRWSCAGGLSSPSAASTSSEMEVDGVGGVGLAEALEGAVVGAPRPPFFYSGDESEEGSEGEGTCRPVSPGALLASGTAFGRPLRPRPPPGSPQALRLSVHGFSSQCEHHMLPFHGSVGIAVSGPCPPSAVLAAAVARFSRRLQVQERLTAQVADAVWHAAPDAHALLVVVRSAHMCMVARGVEQHASSTMTTGVRGAWAQDDAARGQAMRSLLRLPLPM